MVLVTGSWVAKTQYGVPNLLARSLNFLLGELGSQNVPDLNRWACASGCDLWSSLL